MTENEERKMKIKKRTKKNRKTAGKQTNMGLSICLVESRAKHTKTKCNQNGQQQQQQKENAKLLLHSYFMFAVISSLVALALLPLDGSASACNLHGMRGPSRSPLGMVRCEVDPGESRPPHL